MGKRWIALGSILMALAVALGALGAHTLKGQISDTLLESYRGCFIILFMHLPWCLSVYWPILILKQIMLFRPG